MAPTLSDLLAQRHLKEASFARAIGIPASTLYSITRGKTRVTNIGVDAFIRIAHGLGMGAEELFYLLVDGEKDSRGGEREILYADPHQRELNQAYAQLNDESKAVISGIVASVATDPARRNA